MSLQSCTRNRINSLTGARFPAIMLIVFSHFEFLRQYGKLGEIYWHYVHNPTMGVDFFFMLSGFGMMLSSIRQNPDGTDSSIGIYDLISFGKKHVSKIYPVYVAFLLVGIPYYLFCPVIENGKSLVGQIVKCAILFSFDLTLLQASTGYTGISHSLNGVCWFLSSLFSIYLVSPIIMKFLKKRVRTVQTAFIGLLITIFISFVLAILFTWIDNHTVFDDFCYGSPYRRIFYVIPGMLIAQIYDFYKSQHSLWLPRFVINGIFEYIVIGLSMIWFFLRASWSYLGPFLYIIDMSIVLGVLFALALGCGRFSQFLSSKFSLYLGEISMYIFISHYNIRMYVDFIVRQLHLQSFFVALIEVVVILVFSFLISVLINRYRTKEKGT